ncbi:Cof-type HAD-IIB family hydrolase [Pannus brasiliensis]|uniref:Cof-type HAD-IIB family hydrolase n=1 Tax=Pannus brasiliensis TaxID=1579216 RepID=UPI003BEEB400
MDIRLIVVDVDGTIAGVSNEVNEPVIRAIEAVQAKGIPVAIATGRMYRSACRFHRAINSSLPLIAYNGAWIQEPDSGKIHRHIPIAEEFAVDLLDYLEQPEWRAELSINFYVDDTLYVRELNVETEIYRQRSGITPVAIGDLRTLAPRGTTKILAMGEDPTIIERLWMDLQLRYREGGLYFTQSTKTFFEVTHRDATKGSATKFLAEEFLGLNAGNVLAIGDNFNDVTMLTYAGFGVAMGDAPPEVKEIADWVAPSVEADGVAAVLERFVL